MGLFQRTCTGSRGRLIGVVVAAVVSLTTACTPGAGPSTSADPTATASATATSVAPSPSVEPSAPASSPSVSGDLPEDLATSAMPPKNFAQAPEFPQNLPDQVGAWAMSGAFHSDVGTVGSYVQGERVVSVSWEYRDFYGYNYGVRALTDPAYFGDSVCGTDDLGLTSCLFAAKNGFLETGTVQVSAAELAKLTDELVAGIVAAS